jgi:hypothetical protein
MSKTGHEIEEYIDHVVFPVTKEELINGLLAGNAPGRIVAIVERLPQPRYETREQLLTDIEEVSRVHAHEVAQARTYEDFLAVVLRHVGDIQHTTKEAYNRVVAHVIHTARHQGILDENTARQMEQRLEAAFAELREPMTEVYDYEAPIDPRDDLPRLREE